ncbi:hypothetical protein [Methanothermobacter sp. THM-2]|uniref:hypothetical protein n=1 Tax=Methanothermobacter sp. THM-2 TaxID=2606912 RepID=UPI001F5B9CC9|nr:hypothetical protein [Methanothermobacter sp. THM-2]
MDDSEIRKLLRFTLSEKRVIEELQIPPDAFIPLLFSIRYGGDWSLRKNSGRFMAVKEKVTRFDEDKMTGRTWR